MGFYGEEKAPENIKKLYADFLKVWAKDTCAPRFREHWTEENPTLGHCSITSFIVQDLLGGEVWGIPLPEGGYHCFNVVNGYRFDLTSEQFGGKKLDYDEGVVEQTREMHFSDRDKYERYMLLKERLKKVM